MFKNLLSSFLLSLSFLVVLLTQGWVHEEEIRQAAQTIEAAPQETPEDVQKHQAGEYPRLERQHSLGAIQKAWDKASPSAGAYSVTYSQQEVIRLRLREFMTTTVVLPSWEKIDDIIIGDVSTFEATRATDHILLLKPKEFIGADSNITVVGKSGLVYTFYVRSEGFNSKNIPDLRVHVHVPGEVPKSFPETRKELYGNSAGVAESSAGSGETGDYPSSLPPRMDQLNFQWSMSGDSSIAPQQVFSDGIRTWFNFGNHLEEQDLPVISRVIDGVDTPVNTRVEGNLVIAESVGVFTLRNGKRVVCVYPSTYKKGASW